MAYDADKVEVRPPLAAGVVETGVIIDIKDGKVKDHIDSEYYDNWKDSLDNSAIKVSVECLHEGIKYQDEKIFTYEDVGGTTKFGANSNLGKFHSYYKKAPKSGEQIQMKTNAKGYFRLVIE